MSDDDETRQPSADGMPGRTLQALRATRTPKSGPGTKTEPKTEPKTESKAKTELTTKTGPKPEPESGARTKAGPRGRAGDQNSAADADAPSRSGGRRSRAVVYAGAAAVVAAVFAAASGGVWFHAARAGTGDAAQARDAALLAARIDTAALTSLDYRNPQQALAKWLSVSTGTVHDQFEQDKDSAAKLIGQAKTSTSATVIDAAVASLDVSRGTAGVLVSLNLKKTPASGAATTSRNRYLASMSRVGGQWKISDLQTVEVQLS